MTKPEKPNQPQEQSIFAFTITPNNDFVNAETGNVIPIGSMDWRAATKASLSVARKQASRWVNSGHYPTVDAMKAGLALITGLDKCISAMAQLDDLPDPVKAEIQIAMEML